MAKKNATPAPTTEELLAALEADQKLEVKGATNEPKAEAPAAEAQPAPAPEPEQVEAPVAIISLTKEELDAKIEKFVGTLRELKTNAEDNLVSMVNQVNGYEDSKRRIENLITETKAAVEEGWFEKDAVKDMMGELMSVKMGIEVIVTRMRSHPKYDQALALANKRAEEAKKLANAPRPKVAERTPEPKPLEMTLVDRAMNFLKQPRFLKDGREVADAVVLISRSTDTSKLKLSADKRLAFRATIDNLLKREGFDVTDPVLDQRLWKLVKDVQQFRTDEHNRYEAERAKKASGNGLTGGEEKSKSKAQKKSFSAMGLNKAGKKDKNEDGVPEGMDDSDIAKKFMVSEVEEAGGTVAPDGTITFLSE